MDVDLLLFNHRPESPLQLGIIAELIELTMPVVAHRHDFWEIAFAVKGSGQHEDQQGRLPILSGDVWIVRPGQWHAYPLVGDSLSIFNLLLSHAFISTYLPSLPALSYFGDTFFTSALDPYQYVLSTPLAYMRLSPQGLERIHALLIELASELERAAKGSAALCVGIVLQILGLLERYGTSQPGPSAGSLAARYDPGVLAAVDYIEQHYALPLTLDEIADQSGYAPTYLTRKFRQYLGMPPIDYLLQVRLQHACALLQNTTDAVTAIALAVGFSDSRYFATRFRAELGVTPTVFRRQAQRQNHKHSG